MNELKVKDVQAEVGEDAVRAAVEELLGENPSNYLHMATMFVTTAAEFGRALKSFNENFKKWLDSFPQGEEGEPIMQPGDEAFADAAHSFILGAALAGTLTAMARTGLIAKSVSDGDLPADYPSRLAQYFKTVDPDGWERAQQHRREAEAAYAQTLQEMGEGEALPN